MLCALLAEVEPGLPGPSVDDAATLLARLACNVHTLHDEELQPYGLGLYPLAALTNHSCDPSTAHAFESTQLVLRALRTIEPGEAVTISYIELAVPPSIRRAELRAGYSFECVCARCTDDAPNEVSPVVFA